MKFLVIFFCFLFSINIFSQEKILTGKDVSKLDSLLMNGEILKVKDFISIKDSLVKKGNYSEKEIDQFQKAKNLYDDMFAKDEFRASLSSDEMLRYISQYKMLNNSFDEDVAGEQASAGYRKFLEKSDNKEYKEAIKFYTIAYFFKERFLNNNNSDIVLNYKLAHKNLRSGNYQEALKLFEYVKSITTDDRLYTDISDSVKYFIKLTEEKISDQNLEKELWQQKDIAKYYVKITAGANLNYTPVLNNPNWYLYDFKGDYIKISKIPSSVSVSYTFSGNVYIWNGIIIGGQYSTGKMTYTPVTSSYILNMPDAEFSYTSYSLFGKYLFRLEAGLRPYAGFGYGKISGTRSEINGVTDRYHNIFNSESVDMTSPEYMLQIGTEYIFKKTNNVMFDFVINIYNVPKNNDSIAGTYFSTCLELGVII